MSHTPGPWGVGNEDKNESPLMVYCNDSLGSRVADVSMSGHGITTAQDRANARLIAAAPDLLAVCKALNLQTRDWSSDEIRQMGMETTLTMMLDAIAKAEGRS